MLNSHRRRRRETRWNCRVSSSRHCHVSFLAFLSLSILFSVFYIMFHVHICLCIGCHCNDCLLPAWRINFFIVDGVNWALQDKWSKVHLHTYASCVRFSLNEWAQLKPGDSYPRRRRIPTLQCYTSSIISVNINNISSTALRKWTLWALGLASIPVEYSVA